MCRRGWDNALPPSKRVKNMLTNYEGVNMMNMLG